MAACSLRTSVCNICLRVSLGLGLGAGVTTGAVRITGALYLLYEELRDLPGRLRKIIFRRGLAASAVLVTLVIGTFGRILISLSLFPLSSKMSAAGLYALGKGVGAVVLPCSAGVAVAGVLGSDEAVVIGLAACSSDE